MLDVYPFLLEFFLRQSPKFAPLKDPAMRETMGKVATLTEVSAIGGVDLSRLMDEIAAEVKTQTGQTLVLPGGKQGTTIRPEERREVLKGILKDLHQGVEMEILKDRFRDLIKNINAPEIALMEQQLIDEGLPPEELKELCDVHVELFKEALDVQDRPEPPLGHPVHTFMKENRASEKIMSDIQILIGRLGQPPAQASFDLLRPELGSQIELLAEINIHYTRKENQLFPLLEEHHFTGPSQIMWSIHDDVRALIKKAREKFDESNPVETAAAVKEAVSMMRDMIYKEEHILYPTSLEMLSESEWVKAKAGEADIGYAWIEPDSGWPEETTSRAEPAPVEKLSLMAGALELDTGGLNPDQVNLVLTHLPVDLTFIDEDDRVAYYSEGKERIFPRSPAVIGREVRNCHPPKSVHVVNKILDEFKSGSKDTAEFWIEIGGRFIYIRYFAVRDARGSYKGTLEVSQDLTEIRKLEGENRLLDWE
ncbi:MAG: DUF438 domain-containing protein [Candidatus Adiutricales bacterium]